MKSWTEISQQALQDNYRVLQRVAGSGTPVLAVVKANAYGHGLALCAPMLAAAGAPWLGVTDAGEGICARKALAQAGVPLPLQPQVLVMSGLFPEDAEAIVQHSLTPVVWTPAQLEWLAQAARRLNSPSALPVHLEIDSGMSRQGARPGPELAAFIDRLLTLPQLRLGGVFTHFSSAEVAASPQTLAQQQVFESAIEQLGSSPVRSTPFSSFEPPFLHASNSSTLDLAATLPWLNSLAARFPARPLARAGLALYGHCLPLETPAKHRSGAKPAEPEGPASAPSQVATNLRPVLTWKTSILDLREVQTGVSIGYNATFRAPHPMRLALLPAGYADGLRRELSGSTENPGGWVMVHGARASITGRISMNLTSIDVTAISHARPGDEVTLLGPGITAEDHARLAHTIPYEILCGIKATRGCKEGQQEK